MVHKYLALGLATIPYVLIYKCVVTKSFITSQNHEEEMKRYPYDCAIFYPGHRCRTCQFLKPARSKHCNICRACISRHDHHCVWLMNCVGAHNYVYFLSLLLSLSFLLTYGTWLGYSLLSQTLQEIVPPEYQAAMKGWSMYFNIWAIVITADAKIGTVTLLMLMTAPLAVAFLAYHTYLIWAGMTTNESSKWSGWKCDVEDDMAFKAERSQIPGAPRNVDLADQPWPVVSDQILGYIMDVDSNDIYYPGSDHREPDSHRDIPNSPWKLTSMADIENIYDLGFWNNLRDSVGLSVRRKP